MAGIADGKLANRDGSGPGPNNNFGQARWRCGFARDGAAVVVKRPGTTRPAGQTHALMSGRAAGRWGATATGPPRTSGQSIVETEGGSSAGST